MCTTHRIFLLLFLGLAGAGVGVLKAKAQQATTRTTYYDAAHTQRRAVYGIALRGPRPDTVAQGPYRRYWLGGSLAEIGHFTEGQADSIWTRYYPTSPGQASALARRLPMRAGQPNGPFVVFHPNGRLAQRGTYRQGQLVDSLISRTATGQPRLLARLAADSGGGQAPTGRFRQWRSGVTAQAFRGDYSHNNPYPAADTGRYWTGQLAAGLFAGALAEHDPDGQLRVRLLYSAPGRVQQATIYYPAAWHEYELRQHAMPGSGQVVRSVPYWQTQWLGRDLLQQRFEAQDYSYELTNEGVYRVVPGPHLRPPTTCLAAPLPPVVVPPATPGTHLRRPFEAPHSVPYKGKFWYPSKYGIAACYRYEQASRQRLRRGRTRHLLGRVDTLSGQFVRERRRVETGSYGRSVATGAAERTYAPDGSLSSTSRKMRHYEVVREYEHGRLVSYHKSYYDDNRQRIREWDDQGRLLYDARTNRHGDARSRRRDRKGHMPRWRTR